MKTIKHLLAALALVAMLITLLLADTARAQHFNATDDYVTATATTNTTTSEVVFAGSPTKSIRVTSITLGSETNTAQLTVFIGQTPFTVTGVINVTNLTVTSNAGVVIGQPVILQYGGTNWTATVHTTNQLTNVVLSGGSTLGFTPLTNSVLWKCYQPFLELVGVSKVRLAGEALFAAPVRAPLAVQVSPAVVASNRLSVTTKYGTTGSP